MLVASFSGIRGIFGKDLTVSIATKYCHAFYTTLNKELPTLVLGRDSRPSGEQMRLAAIDGLPANIIDVGILPTPAVEEAVRAYKADGGIIITASHNPPEHNGFKFLDKDGAVLRPEHMQKVIDVYEEFAALDHEAFLNKHLEHHRAPSVEKKHEDALKHYQQFVSSFFKEKIFGVHVLLDPNGGAGYVADSILNHLGITTTVINNEIGTFPRTIEPSSDALQGMVKHLNSEDIAFGCGFDCDADRVEIILKDGTLVSGNHLFALLVDSVLSEEKSPEKETVIVNDATSDVVKSVASSYHAKIKEVEVGEINVVDTMIAHNSPIGGEGSSGGVIVPPSRCRDGILTVALLCKYLTKRNISLEEAVSQLEPYIYKKAKLSGNFSKYREKIKTRYLKQGFLIQETGDATGGLKARKDDHWVWFRQSKTEHGVLRVIADGKDEHKVNELLKEAKGLFS